MAAAEAMAEPQAADSAAPPLRYTVFPDTTGQTLKQHSATWPELVEMLRAPKEWPSKDAMPLIKLATFGVLRTPTRRGSDGRVRGNALRHDANVIAIAGIEGDYDGEKVSIAEAVRLLERHGIRAIVYSSPSHGVINPPKSHGGPRWRVLAPMSAEYQPAQRAALLARLNGALGGILAGESFTLSQTYFFGKVEGQPYEVGVTFGDPVEGGCVDQLDQLEDIAVGKERPADPRRPEMPGAPGQAATYRAAAAAKVAALGRKLRTKDGRREMLKSYIASRSARGFDRAEVSALVEQFASDFFDPADPFDKTNIEDVVKWAAGRDEARRQDGASIAEELLRHKAARGHDPAEEPSSNEAGEQAQASGEGESAEAEADESEAAADAPPKAPKFRYVSLADLAENPPPNRRWVIEDWLPLGSVTALFSGGGFGKSLLAQQLATCVANGVPVFGKEVVMGAVLGYFTEDEGDELRRRQRTILASQGRTAQYSSEGLFLSARVGEANAMMVPIQFDRRLAPTDFFWDVVNEVERVRPVLLILDNIAQLYGGIENDRFQVTQFANYLSWIALQYQCAVLLLGHVAKTEGSEFSGSTAWDAAVRTRLWMERLESGLLELHRKKANYASRDSVLLEFQDGALVEVNQTSGGVAETLAMGEAERQILAALDVFTSRQVATSQAPTATTYLPRLANKEGLLNGTPMVNARRALAGLIDRGEVLVGQSLGWLKTDRHPAFGLARKVAP